MNEENTSFVLQLIAKHPVVIYIIGTFLGIVSSLYIANIFRSLFPKKEDSRKEADKPQVLVVNTNDSISDRYEALTAAQAELIDSQRRLLRQVVNDIMVEKRLDDTIPFRQEILDKLDELLDENSE